MKEEIDFENDYLVINRDMQGKFSYFRWYSASKHNQEEMDSVIFKWNEKQKLKGEEGRPAELITDPFIRSICAYREYAASLANIAEEAQEIQESIDDAISRLQSALADLNRIRGLD